MVEPYEIELYKTQLGTEPFNEWLENLDRNVAARIDARVAGIREQGNLGDCEPLGKGVFELKFDFGPGYRIYFGYLNSVLYNF